MGYLNGSQFNLVVSLRYAPVGGEADFWCELFGHVSKIVADSTDGALSIGHVLLATNSLGSRDADIWVHPGSEVWPNSTGARLWFPFEALDISQNYVAAPTILAHELGHYLYGLRDEYGGGSACVDQISQQASIMENYGWGLMTRWTDSTGNMYRRWSVFFPDYQSRTAVLRNGQPSEFCHDGNHDATQIHPQNNWNGQQSCWTYMAADGNHNGIPYGLAAPGATGPRRPKPAAPPPVVCTELIAVQRTMLILGRSDSMNDATFDAAKSGARFWIDYVQTSEEFGLAIDSDPPTIASALSAVPTGASAQDAWRAARHAVVSGLTPSKASALGDALRASMTEITAGGRAASQVIVLLTDGRQDAGAETVADVLPDLRAAGARVYTIGLGLEQDGALLANLAVTTGGSYFAIGGELSADDSAAAVMDALAQVAAESRDNGGMVSFNPVDSQTPDANGADEAPPFEWRRRVGDPAADRQGHAFRFEVPITRGSTLATLGALWTDAGGSFQVVVRDPAENVIERRDNVRNVAGPDRYGFYEVRDPEPGHWIVQVEGEGAADTRFRTIGFETNDRISLDVSVVQPHVRAGEAIELRARLKAPLPVPGAMIVARVRPPSGEWTTIPFTEHLGLPEDPNEPFTYTAAYRTSEGDFGPHLIVVDARREAGTFDLELDELYRGQPGLTEEEFIQTIDVPEVRRRTVLTAFADAEGRTSAEPIAGYNTEDPWLGADHQRVGRPYR